MPLEQLAKDVRQAYPPEAHHLVEQDSAVKARVKAKKELEKRDGQVRQAEWQARVDIAALRGAIEQIEEKSWVGRWWHRKELKQLHAELEQRTAEARTLAKERRAVTRELKAEARLEKQAREAAWPGAELEVQQRRERHTALEVVYQRRLERERPQQKQHEQERGIVLGD